MDMFQVETFIAMLGFFFERNLEADSRNATL